MRLARLVTDQVTISITPDGAYTVDYGHLNVSLMIKEDTVTLRRTNSSREITLERNERDELLGRLYDADVCGALTILAKFGDDAASTSAAPFG